MTLIRLAVLTTFVSLTGCIAYTPSNTDWRTTPKVIVQVCSPSSLNGKAEVILYRSSPLLSIGLGATSPARGKTISKQEVFESILEDPSQKHDALGILIHSEVRQKFYVFTVPERYSTNWSEWINPIGKEDTPLPEIDRFKYQRGKKPLDDESLINAPRIRYRLETPAEYEDRSRSKVGYDQFPSC